MNQYSEFIGLNPDCMIIRRRDDVFDSWALEGVDPVEMVIGYLEALNEEYDEANHPAE